jgi:hypothetical protein
MGAEKQQAVQADVGADIKHAIAVVYLDAMARVRSLFSELMIEDCRFKRACRPHRSAVGQTNQSGAQQHQFW